MKPVKVQFGGERIVQRLQLDIWKKNCGSIPKFIVTPLIAPFTHQSEGHQVLFYCSKCRVPKK